MRILTYNCCALPVFTEDIVERLELISDSIASLGPDVIVLQEVFFEDHLDVLRSRLPDYHMFSEVRAWRTFGGGLTVFSKFPLVDPQFVLFRQQGSLLRYTALARISRKGFISTGVEPDSGPAFSVVAAHPVADYRAWRTVEAPTERGGRSALEYLWKLGAVARGDPYPSLQRAQLAQLAEHVVDLPSDRPVIVAGDLNVTPDSSLLREFLDASGLVDCMPGSLEPSCIAAPYYRLPHHEGLRLRLDYVLHRDGTHSRLEPKESCYVFETPRRLASGNEVTLSDHFGVLVELHS